MADRPSSADRTDARGRPEASFLRQGLRELAELALAAADTSAASASAYAEKVLQTLSSGGKLMFCGNGGSAADAQHLAAEYVVRLDTEHRRALPAVALTTDTSVLTACGNDLGYDEVFARQVEAVGNPGDLLVIHSTSGESPNLLRAAQAARTAGISTVGVLAKCGGRLRSMVDIAVLVPTRQIPRAQEIHLAIGHLVCQYAETSLFGGGAADGGRPAADGPNTRRADGVPRRVRSPRATPAP